MAVMTSELVIPQRAHELDCLNAWNVTSDPPKRRHTDLMAIKVGWVLVSSFRNC